MGLQRVATESSADMMISEDERSCVASGTESFAMSEFRGVDEWENMYQHLGGENQKWGVPERAGPADLKVVPQGFL